MKKTAKYYNSEEGRASYKKKLAYDKKHNAKKENKDKRVELNKYNREAQAEGRATKFDKKDASHIGGKIVGFEKESVNRGRKEKSRLKGSKRG